jgi:ribosomal protein L7/L12
MDSTIALIGSLLLNIGLLLIVFGQSKKIQAERKQNKTVLTDEQKEELAGVVTEKLTLIGEVKTIKYLRAEYGLSMIEAKNFVYTLQNKN